MGWSSILSASTYYIVYPLVFIDSVLLSIFRLLIAPLLHVVRFIVHICIVIPFQILAKFEPLYIYLATACVIGASTGVALHYVSSYIYQLLNLAPETGPPQERSRSSSNRNTHGKSRYLSPDDDDDDDENSPWIKGRWRLGRKKRLADIGRGSDTLPAEWATKNHGVSSGLLSTAIIEEDDDDDEYGGGEESA
ncbi:hypothetical protein AJ80_09427 [Polytolypa hystricis UAMH7299]|uniref:Uncharacterized protein n=1 Tax=Polytolypa hystricis (strain UAMH7299) TaxID=1447883 RepID=A0A2B7WQS4_POLH7|nr:hypothetical protein AJ80_09427 [Polytolypa hystricis UAMH7299]